MLQALLRLLTPVLLLLLSPQSLAQFARAQCSDPSQSMLWELHGPLLQQRGVSIHLLGSIHVGREDFYPLHPAVEAQFRAADHLVFEVDPRAVSSPQMALKMQQRAQLPQGQTLRQQLSPATLAQLETVLQELGLPLDNVLQFKPWMVALLLTNLQASSLGYDPRHGLENYLMTQRRPDADILELESLEQQLAMLETLHPETFLGYSLQEYRDSPLLMQRMVDAWLCADKVSLAALVDIGSGPAAAVLADGQQAQLAAIHDGLFTQRNLLMADGIETFARDGSGAYFVVVGAGHLLGAGSVVDLLQQRGYTLLPVVLPVAE
jgi:uncharacterized protein YbaP (TraB family)